MMRFRSHGAVLFASALFLSSSLAVPARADVPPPSLEAAALELKPGQYVWAPDVTGESEVRIVVSLPLQVAYVFQEGRLIGAATVSTGKTGKETPTGEFTILEKKQFHRSNLYDDAPMPFMQRLTWDGIALHAGANPGYPASHGCIRLPTAFAKKLFEMTTVGVSVAVVDDVIIDDRYRYVPMTPGAPVQPIRPALEVVANDAAVTAPGARMVEPVAMAATPR